MTEKPPTIFVIDDDSVRTSLTRLLRSAGLAVEAFPSGQVFCGRVPLSFRLGKLVN